MIKPLRYINKIMLPVTVLRPMRIQIMVGENIDFASGAQMNPMGTGMIKYLQLKFLAVKKLRYVTV